MYNLPLESFNIEVGRVLGNALGEVIQVDAARGWPRNISFFRVKIWIQVNKSICGGLFLKCKNGLGRWIECHYERVFKI